MEQKSEDTIESLNGTHTKTFPGGYVPCPTHPLHSPLLSHEYPFLIIINLEEEEEEETLKMEKAKNYSNNNIINNNKKNTKQ